MPKYYFHFRGEACVNEDIEGGVFHSDEAAHLEAVMSAREITASRILRGEKVGKDAFIIVRDDGAELERVPLISVVMID